MSKFKEKIKASVNMALVLCREHVYVYFLGPPTLGLPVELLTLTWGNLYNLFAHLYNR